MPEIKPAVPVVVLLAALGFTFWITHHREGPGARTERRLAAAPTAAPAPSPGAAVKTRRPVSQAEFAQLVEDWRPLNTGPEKRYVYGTEEDQMAARCIDRLGCGEDLIRLMKAVALQDDGIGRVFYRAVKAYLAEKAGPSERARVAAITSDAKVREQWCYDAGAGCTPEELAAFLKLLTTEADRNAAALGSTLKLAKTDPVAALNLAVAQRDAGNTAAGKVNVFSDIVTATGDSALYPAIEALLHEEGVSTAREQLLHRWTHADVSSLVRHCNTNTSNMSADDVELIFRHMVNAGRGTDRREALAAAQELENPEHFDSAAMIVIPSLCLIYPKEMTELAEQIHSPELRERATQRIKDAPEINRELP